MTAIPMHSRYAQSVDLAADQRLEIVFEDKQNQTLRLLNGQGEATLTIEVTESGAALKLTGVTLDVQAETLNFHGRSQVEITSGGDLSIQAAGHVNSVGREHNLRSTHGNCNVRANDDIKLNGERVLVNC
ncbi:MAG: hypothetical protein L0H83_06010 [Salinisphaera sp.]|nr:hypothetical protein [Salinisphaera sp.]